MPDEPLAYWVDLARMGFEDDFARLFDDLGITQAELANRLGVSPEYVSKVLNGRAGNYELKTMAKWARAVAGIVQIRVIKEHGEAVRIVDYETARELDERAVAQQTSTSASEKVVSLDLYRQERFRRLNVNARRDAIHG